MTAILRWWADNPVLTKELRVRMRGARAYWILTGYLAILSFMLFMQYSQWWNSSQVRGSGFSMGSKIGQSFFYWLIGTQAFLVAFITPAITAGAITIEKEQRTLEMLEMTRLSRGSIITGKLLSAISFVALLLVSSLPLTSICFFLGGVSPEQVIYWYLLLLAVSFLTATIGLVWSTIARTTAAAVVLTYCSLLSPWLLTLVFGILASVGGMAQANPWNPMLLSLLIMGLFGAYQPDLFGGMAGMPALGLLRAWDMRHFFGMNLPVWLAPVLTYAILGITLAAVAAARMETFPERKAKLLRLLVAAFVVQQLFFLYGARFAAIASLGPAAGMTGAFPLLYTLTYPVLLLLCMSPIYLTGEVRPVEARNFLGYLASGWTPRGLSRGRPSSGIPYMLALVAVAIGLYCLSFVLVGQAGGIMTGLETTQVSAGPSQATTVQGSSGGMIQSAPRVMPLAKSGHGTNLLHIAISLAVTILGLGAIGMMLSIMIRNRWVAMAILYVVLLGILAAPSVARAGYNSQDTKKPPAVYINLYYLNPLMTVAEATDSPDHFWSDMHLMFARTPIWQVCTASWLFISGLCVIISLPFLNKIASGQPLPYEDMAARV